MLLRPSPAAVTAEDVHGSCPVVLGRGTDHGHVALARQDYRRTEAAVLAAVTRLEAGDLAPCPGAGLLVHVDHSDATLSRSCTYHHDLIAQRYSLTEPVTGGSVGRHELSGFSPVAGAIATVYVNHAWRHLVGRLANQHLAVAYGHGPAVTPLCLCRCDSHHEKEEEAKQMVAALFHVQTSGKDPITVVRPARRMAGCGAARRLPGANKDTPERREWTMGRQRRLVAGYILPSAMSLSRSGSLDWGEQFSK